MSRKRASVEGEQNPADGGRRKRTPIYAQKNKLTVHNKDENYVYRWVNDVKEGTRLAKFLEAGYEFVPKEKVEIGEPVAGVETEPVDSRTSKVVGTNEAERSVTRAYLMRIPKDWFEEDQKAKQDEIDEREKAIKRRANLDNDDLDGFYGGLKLTHDD